MSWLCKAGSVLQRTKNILQLRGYSSLVDEATRYTAGQKLHGYTIDKVVPVKELYLTAVVLSHDKTGAQHLHVARDDSNNVFGVAFRTTPMDSTGVPHILEHTALCGSQKYPIRDPFFKMMNRSLNTFMNAFTANDWTLYPFSTQNKQDYENLMRVYLDSAFFPRLTENDFRQEGWRLEHDNIKDPESPITFKGIVYNEMKGVFSNSQDWFSTKNQNFLMPGHTYGVISGGDPQHITELSWQQLRDFHASHYHPSNSKFYTYGDFNLEEHLRLINELVLDKFEKINPGTDVPAEERWTEPQEYEISCSPDPMAPDPSKQATVAVSYLLGDITDVMEAFTMSLIGHLLVSGEKAPFYQSLLEANIGSDYSPVLGYNGYTKEASFSVGLQGIHPDDVDKVKQIIENTFDTVIRDGFEQERIDALLHKIELSQKHQYDKFGLNLGVSVLSPWNHNADVTEVLKVDEHVQWLKKNLETNRAFLQQKVRNYFKDNRHKLTLVMKPDDNYDIKLQHEETRRLQRKTDALSDVDKKKIYEEGLALAESQNQEEDLSCLPTLQVSDILKEVTPVKTDIFNAGSFKCTGACLTDGVQVQISEQPTCGVTYFRAVSNIRDLPLELKPYVPLFCNIVTKMGAGVMDYKELSQAADMYTGGLSCSPHIIDHPSKLNTFEEGIFFNSLCLDRNIEKMFELWTEIFHRYDLSDTNRLTTLILMAASDLSQSLVGSGHVYAMTNAASHLSPVAAVKETMSGITQIELMKKIAEMKDLSSVVTNLREIGKHVLNTGNMRCSLNATPDTMSSARKQTEHFISNLHAPNRVDQIIHTEKGDFMPENKHTHFEMPFQVNFVSRSLLTIPYTHVDFASLRILGRLMTNKFLHREIREKGGAYGGGATANSAGHFNFYSYRDPNSTLTLKAFDESVEWVEKGDFTQQDIDEAKLAIFSQVDQPVAPGQRGSRLFLSGVSDEMLQAHRLQLFTVNKHSLQDVADKYLSRDKRISSVTLLGPKNESIESKPKLWTIKKQS